MLLLAAMLVGGPSPGLAQPAEKIAVMLDARTEGRATPDAAAARLLAGVRRGFEAIGDVEVVYPDARAPHRLDRDRQPRPASPRRRSSSRSATIARR